MKKLSYNFLILFFMVSCKPEPPTSDLQNGIVNGIVLDKTTNSGIPNATVYLLGNEGGGTWGGGGTPSFILDQTTTNASGKFSFNFDFDDSYGYYCSAEAALYFNYNDEFPVNNNISGGNNVEVELQPIGYLKLNITSINFYEPSDHIDVQSGNIDPLYGNVDTSFLLSVEGNNNYHVVWFIYIAGINEGSESIDIYCPSFDTTYYDLFY